MGRHLSLEVTTPAGDATLAKVPLGGEGQEGNIVRASTAAGAAAGSVIGASTGKTKEGTLLGTLFGMFAGAMTVGPAASMERSHPGCGAADSRPNTFGGHR